MNTIVISTPSLEDSNTQSLLSQTTILWLFLGVAILLNLDRLLLGQMGFERFRDVANIYIDKIDFLSKYWTRPHLYSWFSSIQRGFPTLMGSITPHHLITMLGTVAPAYLLFPILHVISDLAFGMGAYLLLYTVANYRQHVAVLGGFLWISTLYWYNENLIVTALSLLPLLCAVTHQGQRHISWIVRLTGMLMVVFLSYPPYVIPLMPLYHFVLIMVLVPPHLRRKSLIFFVLFWLVYGLCFGTSLLNYQAAYQNSNRSLWIPYPKGERGLVQLFIDIIGSFLVITPVICVFGLTGKRYIHLSLYVILLVLIIIIYNGFYHLVIISSPQLQKATFISDRLTHIASIITFLGAAVLYQRQYATRFKPKWYHMVLYCFIATLLALPLISMTDPRLRGKVIESVGFIALSMSLLLFMFLNAQPAIYKRGLYILLSFLICLLPYKIYSYATLRTRQEIPLQGYLFFDSFVYSSPLQAYRVQSIQNLTNFWQQDFFAAQVLINGYESLGGFSVFYHKNDAQYWQRYIVEGGTTWLSQNYQSWNNDSVLTYKDFQANPNRIMKWLWLNNVAFVRSLAPIEHPMLELIDTQTVPVPEFLGRFRNTDTQTRHYYKVKNPNTRLFATSTNLVNDTLQHTEPDDAFFQAITPDNIQDIYLTSYFPSRITFEGTFDDTVTILSSTNYDDKWELYIDGKKHPDNIQSGPLGMIQITPIQGRHKYMIAYKWQLDYILLITGIILSVVCMIFLARYIGNTKPISQQE